MYISCVNVKMREIRDMGVATREASTTYGVAAATLYHTTELFFPSPLPVSLLPLFPLLCVFVSLYQIFLFMSAQSISHSSFPPPPSLQDDAICALIT